jgi:hypothetical protein
MFAVLLCIEYRSFRGNDTDDTMTMLTPLSRIDILRETTDLPPEIADAIIDIHNSDINVLAAHLVVGRWQVKVSMISNSFEEDQ